MVRDIIGNQEKFEFNLKDQQAATSQEPENFLSEGQVPQGTFISIFALFFFCSLFHQSLHCFFFSPLNVHNHWLGDRLIDSHIYCQWRRERHWGKRNEIPKFDSKSKRNILWDLHATQVWIECRLLSSSKLPAMHKPAGGFRIMRAQSYKQEATSQEMEELKVWIIKPFFF